MNIGERLRILRKRAGVSPEKLGDKSDVSGSYIRRLESEQKISITLETARKLVTGFRALGLDISASDLLDEGELPPPKKQALTAALSDIEVSIKAYIPVYAEVSAGEGMEPIDYVATTRNTPAPETLRAYRVKGLCLDPEIKDGDTLVVDTARVPEPDNLVVVIIEGQASVKRYRNNGDAYLENNHGRYKPEAVHVHGVVVEISRRVA